MRWCLIRGDAKVVDSAGDVDILIAESDIESMTRVLDSLGYARPPAWGRASHHPFVAYDDRRGEWIKLDIVTRLAFGPHSIMETQAEEDAISRRVRAGGAWLLADADRFWALLLHCILDRGDVPERHASALRELSAAAPSDGPLATWFAAHAPAGWDCERMVRAAAENDWPQLVYVGKTMRGARRWREGRLRRIRLMRATLRRLTKLRTLLVGHGMALALLGPDGSGKSTLAAELAGSFYFPLRRIYMGLYGKGPATRPPRGFVGRLGRLWGGYLRGLAHRLRGRFVVYDRYSYDALLSQAGSRRARARRWMLAHAIPAPDLVVLLDVPHQQLYRRKQEHDLASLEMQRQAYRQLAARLKGAVVVRGDRDAEQVRRRVTALMWDRYRRMRSGRGATSDNHVD